MPRRRSQSIENHWRRTVARKVAQISQSEQSQSNDGAGYCETKAFYVISFIHLGKRRFVSQILTDFSHFYVFEIFFVLKKSFFSINN